MWFAQAIKKINGYRFSGMTARAFVPSGANFACDLERGARRLICSQLQEIVTQEVFNLHQSLYQNDTSHYFITYHPLLHHRLSVFIVLQFLDLGVVNLLVEFAALAVEDTHDERIAHHQDDRHAKSNP
jgi:hypothetical protein